MTNALQITDNNFPDRLLTEKQAARYLGFTPRALQNWRWCGGGPAFVKVSTRAVRYRLSDLARWVSQRIRLNTTQTAPR